MSTEIFEIRKKSVALHALSKKYQRNICEKNAKKLYKKKYRKILHGVFHRPIAVVMRTKAARASVKKGLNQRDIESIKFEYFFILLSYYK